LLPSFHQACCNAAEAYNAKAAKAKTAVGKIAVWWRDESLCLLKASGDKPVAKLHTASVTIADPSSGNQPMPLYLLSKEMSSDRGAVCLDGSPPGFYASFTNNSATATSWVLYFKGGNTQSTTANLFTASHFLLQQAVGVMTKPVALLEP
jgi:hypothetical protein